MAARQCLLRLTLGMQAGPFYCARHDCLPAYIHWALNTMGGDGRRGGGECSRSAATAVATEAEKKVRPFDGRIRQDADVSNPKGSRKRNSDATKRRSAMPRRERRRRFTSERPPSGENDAAWDFSSEEIRRMANMCGGLSEAQSVQICEQALHEAVENAASREGSGDVSRKRWIAAALSNYKLTEQEELARATALEHFRQGASTFGATAIEYGSSVMGLSCSDSDMDINIVLPSASRIQNMQSEEKKRMGDTLRKKIMIKESEDGDQHSEREAEVVALRKLSKLLQRETKYKSFHSLILLRSARIPLFKAKFVQSPIAEHSIPTKPTELNIDVTCGDGLVGRKSRLLSQVLDLHPQLKPLCMLLKSWSKENDINDASRGTFNSYALLLFAVFHTQKLNPPMLPPLNEFLDGFLVDEKPLDAEFESLVLERIESWRNMCQRRPEMVPEYELDFLFRSSVQRLKAFMPSILGSGLTISLRTGSVVQKDFARHGLIRIEDPFEPAENVCRALTRVGFMRAVDVCDKL